MNVYVNELIAGERDFRGSMSDDHDYVLQRRDRIRRRGEEDL